jgi:hypothetical protein
MVCAPATVVDSAPKLTKLHAGKQWHAPKAAFRPKSGQNSFEKRTEERKAQAAMKAKEKEMKDEKEAARQVCVELGMENVARTNRGLGTNRKDPNPTDSQGGASTIRGDGGEDAQEARGACEAQGEAK